MSRALFQSLKSSRFPGFPAALPAAICLLIAVSGDWVLSGTSRQEVPSAAPLRPEQEMVQGLRLRGLYGLADLYCRKELEKKPLDPELEADLVIEQMLTRTALAMSADAPGDGLWLEALLPGRNLLQANSAHPRKLVVEFQMILVRVAQAESVRRQVRFGVLPESSLAEAAELHENCRRDLESLQRSIASALPAALQRSDQGGGIPREGLQSLSASVNYQIARCLTEAASLYDVDDRLNRLDALNQVLERVEQVRRQTGTASELNVACELLQVQALRLAGDTGQAQRTLMAIDALSLSPQNRQLYWQQLLTQAIAGAGTDLADPALEEISGQSGNYPETELAALEWLAFKASRRPDSATLQALREWADRIRFRFGLAWGRLANRLLLQAAGHSIANGDPANADPMTASSAVDLALRAAENAIAEHRPAEAVEALRRAASGIETGPPTEAGIRQLFQLRVQIAGLLAEQKDPLAAARELSAVASRFRKDPLAPPVHLRAIWYARNAGQDKNAVELAESLLEEHLSQWPDEDPAGQARLWRAAAFSGRGEWQKAVHDLVAVPATGPHAEAAAWELRQLLARWMETVPEPEAAAILRHQQPLVESFVATLAGQGNPATVEAAVSLQADAIRLALRFRAIDPSRISVLLEDLIQGHPELDPETRAGGLAMLAAGEALGGGDAQRLAEWLHQLRESGHLLPSGRVFLQATGNGDLRQQKQELLEIQLALARELAGLETEGGQKSALALHSAGLLSALGRYVEAADGLELLAAEYPDRLDVQLAQARARSAVPGQASRAIELWRKLVQRLQPQSPAWFEAKHETARLLIEAGQPAEARRMLEFLKAVPPGWSRSEWGPGLDSLLEKSTQASGK